MLALYIAVGIILMVILALLIPLEMTFDLETSGDRKVRTRVGWLFGRVWKDISPRKSEKPKEKPEEKRRRGMKPLLSLLRVKGLPGRIIRLARQILRCLKVRELEADLRVGLDDPADTGMMCAMLWPLLTPLTSSDSVRLRIVPTFEEATFEGSLHGKIRVFLIQIVGYLLVFVLSPVGLRTIRSMVVARWK